MKDEFLTIKEAAEYFGVSSRTLLRWEEKGVLKSMRTIGNQRRYSKKHLADLFKNPRVQTPPSIASHTTPQPTFKKEAEKLYPQKEPSALVALIGGSLVGVFVLGLVVLGLLVNPHASSQLGQLTSWMRAPEKTQGVSQAQVLGTSTQTPLYTLQVNVPAIFGKSVTMLDAIEIKKQLTVRQRANLNGGITTNNKDINAGEGKITGSNIIYSLLSGANIAITGDPQHPTVNALNTGVSSIAGQTGALNFTTGSGISLNGLEISNTGVTSFQGQTGTVTLSGGTGISVTGSTLSNTDPGTGQNIFKIITAGGTNITAGTNNDQLTFAAGSGITITGDTNHKTVTITSNAAGVLSGLTPNGVLYATSGTTATSTNGGTNGYILKSNGPGSAPDWVAPGTVLGFVPFDFITSGTNTTAAMIIGSGASIGFTGTGTINASSLNNATFAAPGAIGSTTPSSGAFTTLTGTSINGATFNGLAITNNSSNTLTIATNKTFTVNNTLTLAATDGTTITFPGTGTAVTTDATQTLTNKTITAGANTITGLTNTNLSGTAGITNANLANASVTVTAGSGLLGGGPVTLGNAVTLTNAGVKSAAAGTGIAIDTATGDITITNNGVTSAVAGTGIGVSGAAGSVTFTNLGVTSLTGTANQVNISGNTGDVILSLPQDIYAGASPTFAGLELSNLTSSGGLLYTDGTGTVAETGAGTGVQCLLGGAMPTWGSCATGTTNYLQRTGTTLSPATGGDSLLLADGVQTTSNYRLEVNGKQTGKALAVFNETGDQDIFTASASGSTKFTIANNGNINAAGNVTAGTYNGNTIGTGNTSGNNSGDVTLAGQGYLTLGAGQVITAGAIALGTNTTGDYVQNLTAGGGLTGSVTGVGSTPTLAVGAGNGITVNADDVALNQGYNFTLTGNNTFSPSGTNDLTLNLDADSAFARIFSSGTDATTGSTYAVTNAATSGTVGVIGESISLLGTATSGTNTITGINFPNVTTIASNNFYGINVGTGLTDILRYNGNQLISGTGIVQSAAVSGSYTGITGTGALNAGSIVSGFGAINVGANTITTTGNIAGGTFNGLAITNNGTNTLSIAAGKTVTFADAFTTVGAFPLTLNTSASTNIILPTTGTLATLAGAETLTNKTLTTPRFANGGFLADANGNALLKLNTAATAINQVTLTNAATGFGPTIASTTTGGDADIDLSLDSKGIGNLNLNNNAIGNVLLGGGSGSTGCTVTNATGAFACSGAITGLGLSGSNTGDVTLNVTGQNYLSLAAGQVITANAIDLSGTNATGTLAALRLGALTGDVTSAGGTYATTIAGNAVTSAKIADNTIDFADISNGLTLDANTSATFGNNVLTLGDNTGNGNLIIAPNAGGQAALIVNKQGANDIFTASDSGATKFTIFNNGNVQMNNYTQNGGVLYTNASGVVNQSVAGAGGQVLQLIGNTPTWVDAGTAGVTFWQRNLGAVSPFALSDDLLLGGNSTSSAKFAFINNTGAGTPTASISAQSGTNSALVLGADSTIQSVNEQTLTLGGTTTGDISFRPGGVSSGNSLYLASSGNVGIGTTAPTAPLHVSGAYGSNAAAIVNQLNSGGDIFSASASGATKFTVKNDGTLVLGGNDLGTPTATTVRGSAATGSNVAGANLTFDASNGTGTGGSGDFIFRTASSQASGVITEDGNSNSSSSVGSAVASLTFSHTTANQSNRLLVVGVTLESTTVTVSGITYGGVSLTKATAQNCSSLCRTEEWYLKAPATGSNSIIISLTGGTTVIGASASTFYNVDQTTPVGTAAGNNGTSTAATVTVAGTNTNQLVVDMLTSRNDAAAANGGQTQLTNSFDINNNHFATSTKPGTVTNTSMGWTVFGTDIWSLIGLPINPVSGSASDILQDRFHITSGGNVGIGTTTPATTLQVGGTITVNGNILANTAPTAGSTSQTTTSIDTSDDTGKFTSLKIGSDGLPVVSYYDTTLTALKLLKCTTADCSSSSVQIVDGTAGCPSGCSTSADEGQYSSLAIGADGNPVIAYYDATNSDLRVVKCGDTSCSSGNSYTSIDTGIDSGQYSSTAIGSDGLPVISYYDNTNHDLKIAKCTTASCSTSTITTVDNSGTDEGKYTSIAIGLDGYPVIGYYEGGTCNSQSNCNPKVATCFNLSCTSSVLEEVDNTASNTDDSGQYLSLVIGTHGDPILSYYNTNNHTIRSTTCYTPSCDTWTASAFDNVAANTTGQYSAIGLGADGLPVVSYYDTTNGDLKISKCEGSIPDFKGLVSICQGGGAQISLEKSADTTNNVGQYTSVAIGPDALPIIAYYDVTNGDLKILKCADQGCQNTSAAGISGGSNIGSISQFFNNVYANQYWGKSFQIAAFDVAEEYAVDDTSIGAGDVVRVSKAQSGADSEGRGIVIEKSDKAYDTSVIGIVSTNPAIKLGDWQDQDPAKLRPVALSGRIPVKIATDSAAIQPGDSLTSSAAPGRAMKATAPGTTIGKALENWTPGSGKDTILMFANLSSGASTSALSDTGNLTTQESASGSAAANQAGALHFGDELASNSAYHALTIKVGNLNDRVASLEANQNLFASDSALLSTPNTFSAASPQQLGLDTLDTKDATISNTLTVLGHTLLSDVGITGKVNIGLLHINGLDNSDSDAAQSYASINTSTGPLKLQSNGYNGIDILNGKISIDTEGNLTAKGSITVTILNTAKVNILSATDASSSGVLSTSAGSATIQAGETSVDVRTHALTTKSLIFATPDQPIVLGAKPKDSDTFTLKLHQAQSEPVKVNWWIVN